MAAIRTRQAQLVPQLSCNPMAIQRVMKNALRLSVRGSAHCRSLRSHRTHIQASSVAPGSTVLVAGATGGVGQLVTAKLIEFVDVDFRRPETLVGLMEGVDAVCCATGTTAFPSSRWEGNNGPRPTDYEGTTNLIKATPTSVKRFILVTSAGTQRQDQLPWAILNLFGVLKFKAMSEQALMASGLPWTVLRPGRLTDGPYTSFDLNTLLKATAGSRQAVQLSPQDDLAGEASRIAVAETVLQSLLCPATTNRAISISSTEGDGPGTDTTKWSALFEECLGVASRVPAAAP